MQAMAHMSHWTTVSFGARSSRAVDVIMGKHSSRNRRERQAALRPFLRSVDHPGDKHCLVIYLINDDVGQRCDDQFARAFLPADAPAIRKAFQWFRRVVQFAYGWLSQ